MKITELLTSFTEDDLNTNSPFIAGLHKLRFEGGDFHETLLGYHQCTSPVPFYTFSSEEITKLATACEEMYDALYDAVGLLLNNDTDLIPKFFGNDFIKEFPEFVEYARHTYNKINPAIYGRFDLAFYPDGAIKFYEFNGDTPTMLFESSCVNHVMLDKIGKAGSQFNEWQEHFIYNIDKIVKPGQTLAVVAKMDITTDALTAEYIYNTAISCGVKAILMDFSDLEYEMMDKVFHYQGDIVHAVYILKPWEEMVEESPDIISEWRRWADKCFFFEPAWRWFTSNKGIWAYIYELLVSNRYDDHVIKYTNKHAHVLAYVLPTYLEMERPVNLKDFVAKPIIGRCSQSIRVYKDGVMMHNTEGWYSDVPCIAQQWYPPPNLPERDQFVTCVWMAPYDYDNDRAAMAASVVTVRECKGDVTNIISEAVYPCMVE